MKAYEFSTRITPDGKLELPGELKELPDTTEIRVIVLVEETAQTETEFITETDGSAFSAESFQKSWTQAIKGDTLPISQMWESISVS